MNKIQIINFLIQFVNILSNILYLLIFGRIIMSWMSMGNFGQRGPVHSFFYNTTEPIMKLVKKIPHTIGMFDLSPVIALIGIDILSYLLILLLSNLAR